MAGDRTMVTELATALGTLPYQDPGAAIAAAAPEVRISAADWERLARLHAEPRFAGDFADGFANGRALLAARDGLRGRTPIVVEWTGGNRPPGDEVAPIDVRIDHVYLVSCKYASKILWNAAPIRVFDGLLATGSWDRVDWFSEVAPVQYQIFYEVCRKDRRLDLLPELVTNLSRKDRDLLREALPGREYPEPARLPYRELCSAVSEETALRWSARIAEGNAETLLWRLLRIGSAPYFVLGVHRSGPSRLRVASPWDWRQQFELIGLDVRAGGAGQPSVNWEASIVERATGALRRVRGHVEIRWSHGRFSGNPEAKVYLDVPLTDVPGYYTLA